MALRRSMMVINFGNDFEVQRFGMWPLSLEPVGRGGSGHNKGVPCGARETITNPAQPQESDRTWRNGTHIQLDRPDKSAEVIFLSLKPAYIDAR